MAYNDLFERCHLALKMKDIQLAEKLAKIITEKNPSDSAGYILMGNVYTAKGEINNAIQAYQHSIELLPNNPESYNNIGLIYRQEGNLPAAFKALETALSLAPDRADISYNLGNICRAQGKNSEAIQYFKKAVKINPSFILGYNSLALSSQQAGKTDDAVRFFNQALEIDANHPTIRLNLGSLEEEAGRLESAHTHYRIAVRSNPGWVIGLKRLANIQFRLRRFPDAEITYRKILSLGPDDPEARLNLSVCISESGRLQEARRMLLEMHARNRRETRILELLARICVKSELFDDAERFYRDILAVAPKAMSVRIDLAELFIRRDKYAEASEQLQYVLSRDKSRPRAYYILGRLARKQGHTKKAVESLEVLMSLDPGFTEGRFQLANLYREQEQFSKAIDQLKLILGKNRHNIDARKLMAELYYEQNKYSEALTHFLALFKEKPDDEFIINSIKKCYDALGEKDKAIRFAESLLPAEDEAEQEDDLSRLESTLNMYDSIIENMPEEFTRKMDRNLRRLNSEDDDGDAEFEEMPEESIYIQDIHEIANENVPIIDVGGIEPVIAVNEEDKTTVFLDEMEEELEEYPELEEDEDANRFEGSFKDTGRDQGRPGGGPVPGSESGGGNQPPIIIPPPSWAKAKPAPGPAPPAPGSASSAPGPAPPAQDQGYSGGGFPGGVSAGAQPPPAFRDRRKNPPNATSPQGGQGGSVSISIPPVITIQNESGRTRISGKAGSPEQKPAGKPESKLPEEKKPATPQDEKKKTKDKQKEKDKKKKDKRGKKDRKKKKRKPLFGRKKKDKEEEKSDAQKREDLFSYLANLTRFLPSDAKKDFQKSGVLNKINKIREKLDPEGNVNSRIGTLFPANPKAGASPPQDHREKLPEEKIADTLTFMTKLTEHLPEKSKTLEIRRKIEHILSTIRRGKDGSK